MDRRARIIYESDRFLHTKLRYHKLVSKKIVSAMTDDPEKTPKGDPQEPSRACRDTEEPGLSQNGSTDSALLFMDVKKMDGSGRTNEDSRMIDDLNEINADLEEDPTRSKIDPSDYNFEYVFAKMGPPGPYQYLQIMMLLICVIPQAFISLNYVFIGFQPDSKCSRVNETELLQKRYLLENVTAFQVSYGSCEIKTTSRVSGTPKDVNVTRCYGGYNYTRGKDVSFVAEWDLICDSRGIAELVQTVVPLGWIVGVIIASMISDKYGRKMTMLLSGLMTPICELSVAFSPNVYVLIILRFLSGAFGSGMGMASYVLATELLVSKHREVFGMVWGMIWSLWTTMLCGIGYLHRNSGWRDLQLCIAIVAASPLVLVYFIDESVLWLHSVGKFSRATDIIRTACKWNKIDFDKVEGTLSRCCKVQYVQTIETTSKSYNILDIIRNRKLRNICLISCLIWFTHDITYYGMYLTASNLVGNFYLNMFLMSLLEIPGCLINLVLLRYKGRRFVVMTFLGMSVLCLLISTCLVATGLETSHHKATASTVSFLLGKFAIGCSYTTLYLYTLEIFPTVLRSTGLGLCSAVSCFGGMMAPFTSLLFQIVSWGPGTVLGALCFVSLTFLQKLPESKGKQLPCVVNEFKC